MTRPLVFNAAADRARNEAQHDEANAIVREWEQKSQACALHQVDRGYAAGMIVATFAVVAVFALVLFWWPL